MKNQSKKLAKRLSSLLLVVMLIISSLPLNARAAQTTANEKIEISVGETKTLKGTEFLSRTTWESSNDDVATVSNKGVIKGVSVGTATVTETTTSLFSWFGGSTRVKTYEVTVTEGQEEEPDVPTVPERPENPDVPIIKVGETITLSVQENGTTSWKSSDTNVATVTNDGVVTGVGEGSVTITATTKSGGFSFWFFSWGGKTTKKTFEIKVVVNDDPTLDPEEKEYTVTFNTTGGSVVESQSIKEGQCVVRPENPEKEGATFAGWYSDAELTMTYDFASPVTDNITLYAKWTEKSEADQYYEDNSEIIEIIDAKESPDVPTEAEVKNILEERGFIDCSITYEYTMEGEYVDAEISESTIEKRPMYMTTYLAESGDLWAIYVINGEVIANPVSCNLELLLDAQILISESGTLTSYDDETGKFYVTIPHEDVVIMKTIDRIDAETLDSLTIEEVGNL